MPHPQVVPVLCTPRTKGAVLALALLLFLSAPLAELSYYGSELASGAYPPEADSIGIPLFYFVVALLVTAPLTWGFVWLCVRRYPGRVSLLAWDRARPIRSAVWTVLIVAAAVLFALSPSWRLHPLALFSIAHGLTAAYFLLVCRSALVLAHPKASASAA